MTPWPMLQSPLDFFDEDEDLGVVVRGILMSLIVVAAVVDLSLELD